MAHELFASDALLADGWARDVRITIDDSGSITSVATGAPSAGAARCAGPVLPAMPNLHCHAFQRAMAGGAEHRARDDDDFWSWREAMYALAGRITPEDAYAIAAWLYVELLEAGYSSVAEFHYLHRQADGTPYADPAEMALAHVRAARDVGIAITLLPVVYRYGGFGSTPLTDRQQRFRASSDDALMIAARVKAAWRDDPDVRAGLAFHSLRAVAPEDINAALAGYVDGPIHIHAAEQIREVDECLAWSGARPVGWLLDHAPIDARWCLVHATHMNPTETARLAAIGAVAGLCPTTEANLGDGLFPLADWLDARGRLGIGSDSNVCRAPFEELRLLEYGQRLAARRRTIAASDAQPSVAATLWQAALAGGAQALGRNAGQFVAGARADLLVLDADQPEIAAVPREHWLDAAVFSAAKVRDLMSGGSWVVRDGRHPAREAIRAAYCTRASVLARTSS